MVELNLSHNNFEDPIDLHLKRCEILVLNKNYLRYLPCDYLPSALKHLSLDQNDIHHLELDVPFPHLQSISIEKNGLHYIDLAVELPSLKSLNLKYNKISDLQFLEGMSSLEYLNITRNPVKVVPSLPTSLKTMKAEFCDIAVLPSRLPPSLVEFNVLGNNLRSGILPSFWGNSLKVLHLGYNQLKTFPKNLPDSVEEIGLQNNSLTEIPSRLPSSLKRLSIVGNSLHHLPKVTNIRLEVLLVTQNKLTQNFEEDPLKWVQTLIDGQNWNKEIHHKSQKSIRKCFKRYILVKRLRHYVRSRRIYEELLMVALHPDHILQTDVFSPEWFIQKT